MNSKMKHEILIEKWWAYESNRKAQDQFGSKICFDDPLCGHYDFSALLDFCQLVPDKRPDLFQDGIMAGKHYISGKL